MKGWSLTRIAELCGGRLDNAQAPETVCRYGAVGIDTRTIAAGSLFVAIRAARDGHAFLADAARRGAIAALVEDRADLEPPPELPLIRVPETLAALQRWAAAHRDTMSAELIAVTGSSGKTTTKDRIASVLAADAPTHRTDGNLNNDLGVPLTLLGLRPEHRWGVIEIAMNRPGEIARLTGLCRPRHAVITTIGWAHIGAFGSREAILREKLDVLTALDPRGILFHDADPWIIEHLPREARERERLTFGFVEEADCHPEELEYGWTGTRFATSYTGAVVHPCPGPGALKAALAAILVARSLGIGPETVHDVLAAARPRALRMEPRRLGGSTALLDCYNASPESSLTAVRFLLDLSCPGRRWLAFGEMRELGEESDAAHRLLGESAAGLDGAFFLGEACRPALDAFRRSGATGVSRLYQSHEELARDLLDRLRDSDVVLFKGARAMEMEKVFELCRRALAGKEH
jgi:UDP-N-acetylmuramoyl-tripeptide--D-alanyl-D-alanine ligase